MSKRKRRGGMHFFERFSEKVSDLVGSTAAFVVAAAIVILWAALGPLFWFSDTWQLVINTGTTIVTFLMVFLIQRSQKSLSTKLLEVGSECVLTSTLFICGRRRPRRLPPPRRDVP